LINAYFSYSKIAVPSVYSAIFRSRFNSRFCHWKKLWRFYFKSR